MQTGLKQKVEQLQVEVRSKEKELRVKNICQGAGYVAVIVNDEMGKALNLRKESFGYVLASVSTNGAIQFVEDEVDRFITELPEETSGAKKHVVLL